MRIRFVTSATSARGFPEHRLREVAFVGRSNAGKSSLLNAIAGTRIARTSKTPGRTQAINFFEVEAGARAFVLADLPGFGYARAPIPVREAWYRLIEAYLGGREALTAVLMLVDLRRVPTGEDREVLDWLRDRGREVRIVGTKADQVPKAKRKPQVARIAAELGVEAGTVGITSAQTGEGIVSLRNAVLALAGLGRKSLDQA